MAALEQLGAATRQGTDDTALQQFYREKYGIQQGAYAVAEAAEKLTISLPLSAMMTDSEQRMVVDALHEAWRQASPSSESTLRQSNIAKATVPAASMHPRLLMMLRRLRQIESA